MAHPCADHSNMVFYHNPPPRSEASLMAIAQQLLQHQQKNQQQQQNQHQQQQHLQFQLQQPQLQLQQLNGSFYGKEVDPFHDFSSEPTSFFDLHIMEHPTALDQNGPLRQFSCQIGSTTTNPYEYDSSEAFGLSGLVSPPTPEPLLPETNDLIEEGGPCEWMDSLIKELHQHPPHHHHQHEHFESLNPCESTQSCSSELPPYPCTPDVSWREEFGLCGSSSFSDGVPPWTPDPSNEILSSIPFDQFPSILDQQEHQEGGQEQQTSMESSQQQTEDSRRKFWGLSATDLQRLQREKGERGVQTVQLFLDCYQAVENLDLESARTTLNILRERSSHLGDPTQRIVAHFADGLAEKLEDKGSARDESLQDMVVSYRNWNDACPFIKFAHLTANQAILEAVGGASKVHIVDCGIMQGVQWAALLQAFATQPEGVVPPRIRITGIPSPKLGPDPTESLLATSRRLSEFASLLKLDFEFRPLNKSLEELEPSMLEIEEDEAVAVNFMLQLHHLLDDSMETLRRVLKTVQETGAKIVTVAEYEASIGRSHFASDFVNAFSFYSAIFESLESALQRDDPRRIDIERILFAKEMREIVNGNSSNQVLKTKERRENNENWRSIIEGAGFWSAALSHYAMSQARLLLGLYSGSFKLMEGHGFLSLGWIERPVITVSAWHC